MISREVLFLQDDTTARRDSSFSVFLTRNWRNHRLSLIVDNHMNECETGGWKITGQYNHI